MNSLSLAWNSDRGSTEGSARGVSTLKEYADLASIVLMSSREGVGDNGAMGNEVRLRGAAQDAPRRVRSKPRKVVGPNSCRHAWHSLVSSASNAVANAISIRPQFLEEPMSSGLLLG